MQLAAARRLDGARAAQYLRRRSASVTLMPGTGGVYQISVDGVMIWDRKIDGGFPDAAQLKQRLRDHSFPDRSLGHSDGKKARH